MVAELSPAISVCIPVYNREDYIEAAINSVLEQDFKNFELIVVDNCSTDNTKKLVKALCKIDNRIIFYENDENIGMVENFNRCLDYARGDYIKFICSDDMLLGKGVLRRFHDLAECVSDVAMVACGRNIIRPDGKFIRTIREYVGVFWCPGTDVINDCLLSGRNKIGEPTAVMFPRKDISRGFDARYKQILDLEYWFYLLQKGKFVYTDEPLVGFRHHDKQATQINFSKNDNLGDIPLLYNDYLNNNINKITIFERNYLWLKYCRRLWKLYKNKKIEKKYATEIIKNNYGILRFHLHLPLYSFFKRLVLRRIKIDAHIIN